MLAASLAGFKQVAEKGYDVEELSKYLDMVNINTYDYHGFWDKKTGHHSPMRESGSRDMVIIIPNELQYYIFRKNDLYGECLLIIKFQSNIFRTVY